MKTFLFVVAALAVALQAVGAPVEIRAPLLKKAPVIDGKISDDEWRGAVRIDGFAWNGQLEKRRATGFVGATEDTLYFAVRTQLPAQGDLIKETARDSENLIYDDSLEVWLDAAPGEPEAAVFSSWRTLSAMPGGRRTHMAACLKIPAGIPIGSARRRRTMASGISKLRSRSNRWPPTARRRTVHGDFNLTRNWKNEWAFSSLTGDSYQPQARVAFVKEGAPVVHQLARGDAFDTRVDNALTIYNPGTAPLQVKAFLKIERDVMPEFKSEQTLTLAPGETKEIALKTVDAATKKWKQTARVTSPNGDIVYFARDTAWSFFGPSQWIAKHKEIAPLDFQFAYYPYANKMRILADVSNLPKNAKLQSLRAVIAAPNSDKPIKSVVFDHLLNGRQEVEIALPPLNGTYNISLTASGENVPSAPLVKTFERSFPWEHNPMGRNTRVYPPFTPIVVKGPKISTVLREHEMNGAGLWTQVTAAGAPLLAAPMRYEAVIGGARNSVTSGALGWTKNAPNEAAAMAVSPWAHCMPTRCARGITTA